MPALCFGEVVTGYTPQGYHAVEVVRRQGCQSGRAWRFARVGVESVPQRDPARRAAATLRRWAKD
eukprot:2860540-Lingulodinium_polyedra.AAC.1